MGLGTTANFRNTTFKKKNKSNSDCFARSSAIDLGKKFYGSVAILRDEALRLYQYIASTLPVHCEKEIIHRGG